MKNIVVNVRKKGDVISASFVCGGDAYEVCGSHIEYLYPAVERKLQAVYGLGADDNLGDYLRENDILIEWRFDRSRMDGYDKICCACIEGKCIDHNYEYCGHGVVAVVFNPYDKDDEYLVMRYEDDRYDNIACLPKEWKNILKHLI